MDIKNKTVLILGGWGLVGSATARKVVEGNPKKVILTSLHKEEAEEICEVLSKEFNKKNFFVPFWGNIFVRYEYKDMDRQRLLDDDKTRRIMIHDIVDELDEKMLRESCIYQIIKKFKPDVIIDCINTATGIAYQNIYNSYNNVLRITDRNKEKDFDKLRIATEKLICTSYVPQLIRHVQILYNSMRRFGVKYYFKVGTSGTGGMGLNIPFTHSEEKPSRVLLSKSSIAGAHTLLLFLMARTPNSPLIKEIKPTAAIAWKKIAYGKICRGGRPIQLYDINVNDTEELSNVFERTSPKSYKVSGELKTVYIDTGENGIFSRGEFEAITTNGQMEFVTPEEIAENIFRELQGGNTGNDIISALDASAMEPSYRAGFLQHRAAQKIRELERKNRTYSVAFEMLGPPRLSKLLYEAHLINLLYKNFGNFLKENPKNYSTKFYNLIAKDHKLRNEILSIGIPILLPNGKEYLRGPEVKIPSVAEGDVIRVTKAKIEKWARDGWLDLRAENWLRWRKRFERIISETEKRFDPQYSSRYVFNKDYWHNFEEINIGKIVGWIFINEEKGLRMKG